MNLIRAASLAGAALLAGAAPAASSAGDVCRLLTKAEIVEVQSGSFVETKATAKEAGGFVVSDCFYRMEPFDRSVSLEVTRRASGAAGKDPVEHWERLFRGERGEAERDQEEARRESGELRGIEREKAPPIPVEGVGDEAFWIGNRASGVLYALVRARHVYVRVSVGGPGSEREKRVLAAELARKALKRL